MEFALAVQEFGEFHRCEPLEYPYLCDVATFGALDEIDGFIVWPIHRTPPRDNRSIPIY
jgi:hypothetical protein